MKTIIIQVIQMYALQYGVDPHLAVSVAEVESGLNPSVVGVTGDVGLFQLQPASFPGYTVTQLKDPMINIELGVKYLARLKASCYHRQAHNWLICWNVGPAYAHRIKHPAQFPYVLKVDRRMAGL